MYLPLIGVPKQYLLVLDKRDRISKVKDLLHQMIETEKDIIMAEVLDHHVARIVVSCWFLVGHSKNISQYVFSLI